MANNNDGLDCFDDKEAIDYILKNIFIEYRGQLNAEQVQYILDCEYDYYESKGYFDDEDDEERQVEIDEDEEFDAICARVRADGRNTELSDDLISAVLDANYAYCEETGVFED